jgi:hypothetical protein
MVPTSKEEAKNYHCTIKVVGGLGEEYNVLLDNSIF